MKVKMKVEMKTTTMTNGMTDFVWVVFDPIQPAILIERLSCYRRNKINNKGNIREVRHVDIFVQTSPV